MQSEEKTAEQRLAERKKAKPLFEIMMRFVRVVDVLLRLYEHFFNDDGAGG